MSVQRIARGFARSASRYDAHAQVQFQCAEKLALYMDGNTRHDLVDGDVLEVGCGTGIVSRRVVEMFAPRSIEITDLCDEMLLRCRMRLGADAPVTFNMLDIAKFTSEKQYALIVAAFVLQWIDDLDACLLNLTNTLKPGGKLFFSLPTAGSFPEWRNICKQAGVTYTGNSLPSGADFRRFAADHGLRLSVYEETFPVNHQSLQQFLVSLKSIGAGTSLSPARLTISETKRLLQAAHASHPGSFTATYKVLFGHFSRLP